MTPRVHRVDWRHQRDKYGVIHRAWSVPKVRSRQTGERLWHTQCRRLNTQEVTTVIAPVTCFWCLSMELRDQERES